MVRSPCNQSVVAGLNPELISIARCSLDRRGVIGVSELTDASLLKRRLANDALGLLKQILLLLQKLLALFLVLLGARGLADLAGLLLRIGPSGEHLFLHDAHGNGHE